jgi:simple sugar transport system substrate-binding protein
MRLRPWAKVFTLIVNRAEGVFPVTSRTLKALLVGAVAALGLTAGAALAADAKTKVAFVYVGPIGDHGWSYRHNEGRLAIEKAFPGKVETTYVESVPEGADAERVIQQLAAKGNNLIFTTSFGYMEPTLKVAARNPKVFFEHATGFKRSANVATYAAKFHEGRTVIGLIAGKMTKTGVVGYIASVPIPEVVSGINAFTLALKSVRPDAQVKVIYVNSWYDPGKEAAAAKALLDQGADILTQHTDSPAPIQVAEERGVYAFGQASDMTKFGPKAHLTAIVDNWDAYYVARTKAVMEKTWKSGDVWEGFETGMVALAPYNPVLPKDVVDLAETARKDIIAGKRHPFTGPILDKDGKERVAAGKTATDILSMDWYVQGVSGDLPKK